ncbi:MAG: bifunctional folylpolyglutamate synthase/dihydrofolate synthase, partial [Ramlibacter sp.]
RPTPRAAGGGGLGGGGGGRGGPRGGPPPPHAGPREALAAAVAAADPADRIVVFGSFFTVGGVLADGTPRLQARHLGT